MHVTFSACRVTLSLFALNLGASAFTVGTIISLIAAIPIIFCVRWGRHIDHSGIYTPMLLASALELTATLLAYCVPRIETLFIVSLLVGSGFMLFHICINQATALIGSAEERTKNFNTLALAFSTSGFIGPVTAGFSIDAIGHRNTFLLSALFALLAMGLLRYHHKVIKKQAPRQTVEVPRHELSLLHIPEMVRVFIISGLLSMCWDLYSFVMPIHGSSLGLSATTIGLILGSFGIAIFGFRLIMPWIIQHFTERQILLCAMVLTGLVFIVLPLVKSVPLLMLVSFVMGIGLGGTQPIIMAMLFEQAPAGRGAEAAAIRTRLFNITQAGIPMIFGALGAWMGMTPIFVTMGLALLVGAWYARG